MAIYCVGDIHGKFPKLATVLLDLPDEAHVICVGDIGLGFADSMEPTCLDEVNTVAKAKKLQVWLMRGNHDAPNIWLDPELRSNWNAHLSNIRIPLDIHRMKINNVHVMMVGGATSLDRSHPDRIDGKNWWSSEGVSTSAPQTVRGLVEAYGRADLLLTHAGPLEAKPGLERDEESFIYYSTHDPSLAADVLKERKLLSEVVDASQSKTVAFGHYHITTESNNGPIRYRCCAELEAWEYVKRSKLPPLSPIPMS